MLSFLEPVYEGGLVNGGFWQELIVVLKVKIRWDVVICWENLINFVIFHDLTCRIIVMPCLHALIRSPRADHGEELEYSLDLSLIHI